VYDVSEADGERFISMEFIEGEDLASHMRRLDRLHRQTALRVAREICLGLAALHERGVVHRDLKPGNIMLDREGHVRIVDFGLAVTEGSAPSQVAGTLGFVAPECLRGEPPTARSDLYSLGRLLEKLFAAKAAARPDSSDVVELDPGARSIISKCLADDPTNRPASALEVARALGWDPLEVARAAGRLPTPTEVADAPVGRPLAARLAWTALGITVAGLAFILLGHTFTSAFSRARPLPPADLQFRARTFLGRVGYADSADSAGAYRLNPAYERGPLGCVGICYCFM
jgi:serine/threonine-protein kinase